MALDIIKSLYNKTNGGADIIMNYLPNSVNWFGTQKKFKIREEKTASAKWFQYKNGTWAITDFGGSGKAMDAISIVMEAEGLNREEAMKKLCAEYGITTNTTEKKMSVKTETLKPGDKEGDYELKTVPLNLKDACIFAPESKIDLLAKYGWEAVMSLRVVYKDKVVIYTHDEQNPKYVRKCFFYYDDGNLTYFYKVYSPNAEKKYRFMYLGKKPKDYINGLYEAKMQREQEADQSVADEKRKKIVICCGERDAAVALSFGCLPIWFNSETSLPDEDIQMKPVTELSGDIYFIPDIDATGYQKGMEFEVDPES